MKTNDELVATSAVREIAKTVYMVTSSKWRRCSKLLEFLCYGPFSSVTFRLHCYVQRDFAHVHLDKECAA